MINRPVIAITMGDAAGVGPEIIVKSLTHPELYDQSRPVVIGDTNRLREAARIVGAQLTVNSLTIDQINEATYTLGTIDCVDLKLIPLNLPWGQLSPIQATQPSTTWRSQQSSRRPARCTLSARRL